MQSSHHSLKEKLVLVQNQVFHTFWTKQMLQGTATRTMENVYQWTRETQTLVGHRNIPLKSTNRESSFTHAHTRHALLQGGWVLPQRAHIMSRAGIPKWKFGLNYSTHSVLQQRRDASSWELRCVREKVCVQHYEGDVECVRKPCGLPPRDTALPPWPWRPPRDDTDPSGLPSWLSSPEKRER